MVKPSLLIEWTLSRAEAFLNALLVHAHDAETLFAPLQQKRIRIVFEPMKIGIEIEIRGAQIYLSSETPRPAVLTLTGTPVQFLNTLASHSVANLHIMGDIKMAQALQRAMNGLDIDTEGFLENIVGGTLAHALLSGAKRAQSASKQWAAHTLTDVTDYCHYEIRTAASQPECDAFYKDVNALRYAVDHLSAKITQLKRRIEDHPHVL